MGWMGEGGSETTHLSTTDILHCFSCWVPYWDFALFSLPSFFQPQGGKKWRSIHGGLLFAGNLHCFSVHSSRLSSRIPLSAV